jgi:2-oxoglutarate dehydrogenase E1 component
VLLLPHGYEGQGPEHSSARLERFLQLAAEDNLRIVNCTTAAQYFHILRVQAATLESDRKPLVVMTPKSLLRHPRAGSSLSDLSEGSFKPVIDTGSQDARDAVRRLVLCSGKVAVDLATSIAQEPVDWVAVVRVEELYPFPKEALESVIWSYPKLEEAVWLQEEPANMGAWAYMEPHLSAILTRRVPGAVRLRYVGRPERASTAEGSTKFHEWEQERILKAAFEMGDPSDDDDQSKIERRGVQSVG